MKFREDLFPPMAAERQRVQQEIRHCQDTVEWDSKTKNGQQALIGAPGPSTTPTKPPKTKKPRTKASKPNATQPDELVSTAPEPSSSPVFPVPLSKRPMAKFDETGSDVSAPGVKTRAKKLKVYGDRNVEIIYGAKLEKGELLFFVKWEGLSRAKSVWVPMAEVEPRAAIDSFIETFG